MDEFAIENPSNIVGHKFARLIPLDKENERYIEVSCLFYAGWQHPKKPCPRVDAIYKVVFPESKLLPYNKYRESVSRQLTRVSLFRRSSPERFEALLFHGTARMCSLGESIEQRSLCSWPSCKLCGVINQSFSVAECGRKNKFTRFGKGIYTTSASSKADSYFEQIETVGTQIKPSTRILLVNRVVVGKTYASQTNMVDLLAPPPSFHSVTGVPGEHLNYEETVVYNDDAIRPAFLVAYR